MKINSDESKRLAKIVGAKDKECFFNSVMALAALGDPSAVYVEGFCVAHDLPIIALHGWIEREGGDIIDPTPVYHSERTEREYFPVDRYTLEAIRKRVTHRSVCLPLVDIWERESRWREAYEKAEAFAYPPEMVKWLKDHRAGNFQKVEQSTT